jgi:fatty acid desaturase
MLKKVSEIISSLAVIKMTTYQLVILFILSFIVPGTLIMFYFYRDIFVSYDLTRTFLIIIAISTVFVMTSKGAIDWIGTLYSKHMTEKEQEEFESALTYVALRLTLLGCGISLFVCYLLGSPSKTLFVSLYLIVIVTFCFLTWAYLDSEADESEKDDSDAKGKEDNPAENKSAE